jgi:hypothetical protein
VDRREEPPLAGDLVDGLEEIGGGAGISGVCPEDNTDTASLSFVETREKRLKGGKAGLAFEASMRHARDRGVADRAGGREKVGGRVEPQPSVSPVAGSHAAVAVKRPFHECGRYDNVRVRQCWG